MKLSELTEHKMCVIDEGFTSLFNYLLVVNRVYALTPTTPVGWKIRAMQVGPSFGFTLQSDEASALAVGALTCAGTN